MASSYVNLLEQNKASKKKNETFLRACLRRGGGPQVGEVTRLGWVTRLFIFDHIYMIGGVTRRTLPRLPGVPHLHVTGPNTTFRGPHVSIFKWDVTNISIEKY